MLIFSDSITAKLLETFVYQFSFFFFLYVTVAMCFASLNLTNIRRWFGAEEIQNITPRCNAGFNLIRVCNVKKLRKTSTNPFPVYFLQSLLLF